MNDLQKKRVWISLLASLILILGMFIGFRFHDEMSGLALRKGSGKIDQVMRMIQKKYVDSVDIKTLEASSIEIILSKLDPHSVFIPVEELEEANESLEGNFEGIGIEFYLLHDTIYVVSAISGGPSEQLGIKAGDQIIEIDGKNVAGKKITNKDVMGSLRGPSGSKVQVKIKRATKKDLLPYTITRGNIPIHSVDVAYMPAPAVGLIKISSFGSNTHDEFKEALQKLEQAGAESLVNT
jgi:carboxyl-terminal processing protease